MRRVVRHVQISRKCSVFAFGMLRDDCEKRSMLWLISKERSFDSLVSVDSGSYASLQSPFFLKSCFGLYGLSCHVLR